MVYTRHLLGNIKNYMQQNKGNLSLLTSIIIVLVIIGAAVYFGFKKTDAPAAPTTTMQTTDENTNQAASVAQAGDLLTVNYTGKLTDGTVFDSNVLPQFNHVSPFQFTVGAGQVIKGWDEGFIGMKVGEKRTLTIPPEKGYGATAHGPIPANATLIFDVELVAIN